MTDEEATVTDTYNLSELPGRLYQFAGIAGPLKDGKQNWKYPPGLFRYICKARDYRTDTEKIVYQGVGGVADGKFWLAPIFDWASQFTLVPEPVESVLNQILFQKSSRSQSALPGRIPQAKGSASDGNS